MLVSSTRRPTPAYQSALAESSGIGWSGLKRMVRHDYVAGRDNPAPVDRFGVHGVVKDRAVLADVGSVTEFNASSSSRSA